MRNVALASLALLGLSISAAQAGPFGIDYGTASSFAVLGGSTVTNIGITTIHGDLGVAPGTSVTGFAPGAVTQGTIHAGDAVASQAHADLATAYNAALGAPVGTVLTGQDLGGRTLKPGAYTFASLVGLTGALTLDAGGDSQAAFLFHIGSTLTTASNASVVMANGGQGRNVVFQVGSSATLGTGTAFTGTLLAAASITLNAGTTIESGRALARDGAVTLSSNSVSIPVNQVSPVSLSDPTPSNAPEPAAAALLAMGVLMASAGRGRPGRYAAA